jgi:hypothetical protein
VVCCCFPLPQQFRCKRGGSLPRPLFATQQPRVQPAQTARRASMGVLRQALSPRQIVGATAPGRVSVVATVRLRTHARPSLVATHDKTMAMVLARWAAAVATAYLDTAMTTVRPRTRARLGFGGDACRNGGTVTGSIGSSCGGDCTSGYGGDNCQIVEACATGFGGNPCQNGGDAIGTTGSCGCSCLPGYNNGNCETTDACTTGFWRRRMPQRWDSDWLDRWLWWRLYIGILWR